MLYKNTKFSMYRLPGSGIQYAVSKEQHCGAGSSGQHTAGLADLVHLDMLLELQHAQAAFVRPIIQVEVATVTSISC